MKVADLEAAVDLSKKLKYARERLAQAKGIEPTNAPVAVSIAGFSMHLYGDDAYESLTKMMATLIEREIRDLKSQLCNLGVYE